jgi:hypothetical protein
VEEEGRVDVEGCNFGVSGVRGGHSLRLDWTLGAARVSTMDERNGTLFRVGETAALRVRTSPMACLNGRGSRFAINSNNTVPSLHSAVQQSRHGLELVVQLRARVVMYVGEESEMPQVQETGNKCVERPSRKESVVKDLYAP